MHIVNILLRKFFLLFSLHKAAPSNSRQYCCREIFFHRHIRQNAFFSPILRAIRYTSRNCIFGLTEPDWNASHQNFAFIVCVCAENNASKFCPARPE